MGFVINGSYSLKQMRQIPRIGTRRVKLQRKIFWVVFLNDCIIKITQSDRMKFFFAFSGNLLKVWDKNAHIQRYRCVTLMKRNIKHVIAWSSLVEFLGRLVYFSFVCGFL